MSLTEPLAVVLLVTPWLVLVVEPDFVVMVEAAVSLEL